MHVPTFLGQFPHAQALFHLTRWYVVPQILLVSSSIVSSGRLQCSGIQLHIKDVPASQAQFAGWRRSARPGPQPGRRCSCQHGAAISHQHFLTTITLPLSVLPPGAEGRQPHRLPGPALHLKKKINLKKKPRRKSFGKWEIVMGLGNWVRATAIKVTML